MQFLFNTFRYNFYRSQYDLPSDFRFNGYFIKIFGEGKLMAGEKSYVSYFSHIFFAKGTSIKIGDNVSIAHNVRIYSRTFDPRYFVTTGEKSFIDRDVVIGNNVIIGNNSFIMPGVVIGDNVVIGANSVVSKNIPSGAVFGGTPLKEIFNKGFQ